jgi:hypothetical protein
VEIYKKKVEKLEKLEKVEKLEKALLYLLDKVVVFMRDKLKFFEDHKTESGNDTGTFYRLPILRTSDYKNVANYIYIHHKGGESCNFVHGPFKHWFSLE